MGTEENSIIYEIANDTAELVEKGPPRFNSMGVKDRREQIKTRNIYTKEQRAEQADG